ncbi:MAG: hypothetical protein QM572_08115 [Nocardioides sp.]
MYAVNAMIERVGRLSPAAARTLVLSSATAGALLAHLLWMHQSGCCCC